MSDGHSDNSEPGDHFSAGFDGLSAELGSTHGISSCVQSLPNCQLTSLDSCEASPWCCQFITASRRLLFCSFLDGDLPDFHWLPRDHGLRLVGLHHR